MSQEPVSSNRRIAKNTAILYFRMLFVLFVSLFTTRIVIHSLGNTDYGLYNVVAGVMVMFAFLNGSLSESTTRFLTYELGRDDSRKLSEVFAHSFHIHAGLAFLVFVVAEVIGVWAVNYVLNIPPERLFACNVAFQMVILGSVLAITQTPLNALVVAHERMGIYAYTSIFAVLARCLIAYAVMVTPYDRLVTYAFLEFLIGLLNYGVYWGYCRLKFPDVCRLRMTKNRSLINSMLGFSTWNLLGSLVWVLRNYGVNVLINIFFGPIANAANAIAMSINNTVTGFTNNFMTAMNPQIIKSYAAGESARLKTLVFKGGKFSFYLLVLLCYPLIFETRFLLRLWLDEAPDYTIIFSRLILATTMLEVFNHPVQVAVGATGQIKWYQIVICTFYLIGFPLAFFAYSLGAPPYSVYVLYLMLSFFAVTARLYFIEHLLHISAQEYLFSVMGRCALVALLALGVPLIFDSLLADSFPRFVFMCLICTLSSSVIIYSLGMDNTERSFVKNAIQRIFSRWIKTNRA